VEGYVWYRSLMEGDEGEIYDGLYRALKGEESERRVPKCDPARLSVILELVCMDHPEIFWSEGYRYRSVRGEPTMTVLPTYSFAGKKQRALAESLEIRTSRILSPLAALPAEDALEQIHRFVLEQVKYDRVKKNYSHQILGVLHHGIGVCEGIAKTVKHLCDRLDIPAIVVLGPGSPEQGAQRHAWNLIRIGSLWRHYDFTYDLSASRPSYACHRYYAMTDEVCYASHGPSEHPLPPCR